MSATLEKVPQTGARRSSDGRELGALLLDMGRITAEDAEKILRAQKDMKVPFGVAAVRLGFVTEQDVQKALALQFDYPYIHPGESPVSEEVTAAYRPFSHQVEALRALRSQILLRTPAADDGARVIAVVSPDRSEGRSYLAANLAVVFSQLGENTLLVDADLRNPRQHALFGVAPTMGLSTLLAGRVGVEAIHRVPKLHGLSVLPAGPRPPNPAELVARVPFLQQLRAAGPQFDVIVVDTPAAKLGPDAEAVAGQAGNAIFVARTNASRRDDVFTLRERVIAANASVIGVVLNDV